MRHTPSLHDLLVALYDSMEAAQHYARSPASPKKRATAPGLIRRARKVLSIFGAESMAACHNYDITEVCVRFECELYQHHGKIGLMLSRRHLWRTPPRLPMEIRLYGSQPIKTEVLLGGTLFKRIAGRPIRTSTHNEF